MATVQYGIFRRGTDRLDIELRGELRVEDLSACEAAVRMQLGVAKQGAFKVVVDLQKVVGYSLEARDALVALQRHLGAAASQTAYVTASSAGRALALWTGHMTPDQVVKNFSNRDDAVGWLIGDVGPASGVRPMVHRAERATVSRRKRTSIG